MDDAYSAMLDLGVALAEKRAAGASLTPTEQAIADVLWIDTQVSPNGFDGWLRYTTNARMLATLAALELVGCPGVKEMVIDALAVAQIDPAATTDAQREARVNALTDYDRDRLMDVSARFYDAAEACMAACQAFARARGMG